MKVMAHQGLVQPIANTVSGVNGVVGVVSRQGNRRGQKAGRSRSASRRRRRSGGRAGWRGIGGCGWTAVTRRERELQLPCSTSTHG